MLEPAFRWARGDESIGFSKGVVCSNCDHLKFFVDDKPVAELDPDRNEADGVYFCSVASLTIRAAFGRSSRYDSFDHSTI